MFTMCTCQNPQLSDVINLQKVTFLFYQTDLVNLKQLSLSGSVNSARYMPRRFAFQYIYPPLFTSPSGDSCILLTYRLALR